MVERAMEQLDRVGLGARLHAVERAIDDALGDRLLALFHDRVHEFGYHQIVELRVRIDLASLSLVPARHVRLPLSVSLRFVRSAIGALRRAGSLTQKGPLL